MEESEPVQITEDQRRRFNFLDSDNNPTDSPKTSSNDNSCDLFESSNAADVEFTDNDDVIDPPSATLDQMGQTNENPEVDEPRDKSIQSDAPPGPDHHGSSFSSSMHESTFMQTVMENPGPSKPSNPVPDQLETIAFSPYDLPIIPNIPPPPPDPDMQYIDPELRAKLEALERQTAKAKADFILNTPPYVHKKMLENKSRRESLAGSDCKLSISSFSANATPATSGTESGLDADNSDASVTSQTIRTKMNKRKLTKTETSVPSISKPGPGNVTSEEESTKTGDETARKRRKLPVPKNPVRTTRKNPGDDSSAFLRLGDSAKEIVTQADRPLYGTIGRPTPRSTEETAPIDATVPTDRTQSSGNVERGRIKKINFLKFQPWISSLFETVVNYRHKGDDPTSSTDK